MDSISDSVIYFEVEASTLNDRGKANFYEKSFDNISIICVQATFLVFSDMRVLKKILTSCALFFNNSNLNLFLVQIEA